jgi:hypothetical protein
MGRTIASVVFTLSAGSSPLTTTHIVAAPAADDSPGDPADRAISHAGDRPSALAAKREGMPWDLSRVNAGVLLAATAGPIRSLNPGG